MALLSTISPKMTKTDNVLTRFGSSQSSSSSGRVAALVVKNSCGFTFVVFQEPPEPFATLYWAFTLCGLAC
jgi:hypothetical protein